MTKRTFITLVLLLAAFAGWWAYYLNASLVTEKQGVVYYLKPGLTKHEVVQELAEQGIIRHPTLYFLTTYFMKSTPLQTAEYLFRPGATPLSIWRQMQTGSGLMNHPFSIIPGWSFRQVREALDKTENIKHQTTPMDDKQIMMFVGNPDVAPEGQFFPETYFYTRGMSDLVILKRAYDLMQTKLNEAWERRAANLPYKNMYDALIVASLVEKEAYLNRERPLIAGVIINRLRKNMLLQIDPTVIYGMGLRYNGTIHRADLQEDTVYNTYVHKGLPPTPIAMPGAVSLDAAMHPAQHDFYYFVAKGDGSHQFSKTLQEHHTAVDTAIKVNSNSAAKANSAYNSDQPMRRYLQMQPSLSPLPSLIPG